MAARFLQSAIVSDGYAGTTQQAANHRQRGLDLVVGPERRRVVKPKPPQKRNCRPKVYRARADRGSRGDRCGRQRERGARKSGWEGQQPAAKPAGVLERRRGGYFASGKRVGSRGAD